MIWLPNKKSQIQNNNKEYQDNHFSAQNNNKEYQDNFPLLHSTQSKVTCIFTSDNKNRRTVNDLLLYAEEHKNDVSQSLLWHVANSLCV